MKRTIKRLFGVNMKKSIIIFSLFFSLFFSSCGMMKSSVSDLMQNVQVGMTKQDVQNLFKGKPDFRRFEDNKEEWSYRRYSILNNDYTVIIIRFLDGKVIGMDSFKDPGVNENSVNNQNSGN
jgi:hypothetical protein